MNKEEKEKIIIEKEKQKELQDFFNKAFSEPFLKKKLENEN